ncbi:MAG: hypothetical protein WD066_17340 [Planctomycetaceae bacterium]
MEVQPRICLKCISPFESCGPANRICPDCQTINARLRGVTEAQLRKQRGAKRHNGETINDASLQAAISE